MRSVTPIMWLHCTLKQPAVFGLELTMESQVYWKQTFNPILPIFMPLWLPVGRLPSVTSSLLVRTCGSSSVRCSVFRIGPDRKTQSGEGSPVALSPETTPPVCTQRSVCDSQACLGRRVSHDPAAGLVFPKHHCVDNFTCTSTNSWESTAQFRPALFFFRLRHSCVFPKRLTKY